MNFADEDKNPWFSDADLIRFCRFKDFDFQVTIEMFKKNKIYRKDKKIDTIIEDFDYTEKP